MLRLGSITFLFNKTPVEGRYKSSPINTDEYLLACCRYVELNPVRAGMVARPEQYVWSSYRAKIGLTNTTELDLDPCYLALGETPSIRVDRYKAWVDSAIPEQEWRLIRHALQTGDVTGSHRFRDEIEAKLGRRVEPRRRGRPSRQSLSIIVRSVSGNG